MVGLALGAPAYASADYPDPRREIRHIMPWGAGGATDVAMRGFLQYMERYLGTRIITENIPGGLTAVGMLQLKRAAPDGYTIGTATYDILTVEFQGLAPVSWRDFEVLGMVTEHPSALITRVGRFEDVNAFRNEALSRPGAVRVGNVGTGGVWHQHAAAMERVLGVRVAHIPYQEGSGPQLAALLGGEVDAIVSSLPAALPFVREGKLKVLAVMADERDPLVPEAPTFRELGYNVVYGSFRILLAPKGTPAVIVQRLEKAMDDAWHDPAFQEWAQKAVIGARWRNRAETIQYLENLAPKIQALMRELGVAR